MCSLLIVIFFHIRVSEAQTIKFGVVADVQHCGCENQPQFNRYFAYTNDRLREAKDTFNQYQLDFVINLGDLIEKDWESFDAVLPIFDSINAPGYHVLGNHDFWVADSLKGSVAARLGLKNNYYSFSINNYTFIVLDANDISTNAHVDGSTRFNEAEKILEELHSEKAPNGHVWNGAIGSAQKQWLFETLMDARSDDNHVIIFSHIPLYPLNMNTLWNYDEI